MDFSERIPIYIQVGDAIVKKIITGELKPGEKIPGIKDLAKIFKINANTVVKSLSEIEAEGIIETRRGLGTFIVDDELIIEETTNDYITERVNDVLKEFDSLGISKSRLIDYIKESMCGNDIKND